MSKFKFTTKNIILLSVLLVAAVATFWVMSRLGSTESTSLTDLFTVPESSKFETQKLPSRDIFTDSLENDGRFRQLKDWRIEVIESGEKGRLNPFIKIN